jgi:formate dehydrogenase accessory protein FdhD
VQQSVAARVLERLLVETRPCSLARLAKQLGLAQSQLRRELTALESLGLLHIEHAAARTLIALSEHGKQVLSSAAGVGTFSGVLEVLREQVHLEPQRDAGSMQADWVIDEAPVALLYNGHPHVVMMLTPVDLADFALGYSLAEGIVDTAAQLKLIEILRQDSGYAIHLAIAQSQFDALLQGATRSVAGSASCGLCGTRELSAALQLPKRRDALAAGARVEVTLPQLVAGFSRLRQLQVLNARCGSAHAAAALQPDGSLLVREDIGRHSAVDKLIGAVAASGARLDVLLLTSRVSFEIVRKAAHSGVHTIAAISAPSALALRCAAELGIAMWGFVREGQGNRYG